ncbi:MAG: hypothetical protein KDA63_14715 [Planctomycetales bacterium]|nr:hypothetical protein [Planctomycetales bacterium]
MITAVESAGFHITGMPMDSGGDRIVCAGERFSGGLSGNSFWLAERGGKWFLGTWGGLLYHVKDAEFASTVAIAWLRKNSSKTVSDIDVELKTRFSLLPANDDEFDDQ